MERTIRSLLKWIKEKLFIFLGGAGGSFSSKQICIDLYISAILKRVRQVLNIITSPQCCNKLKQDIFCKI